MFCLHLYLYCVCVYCVCVVYVLSLSVLSVSLINILLMHSNDNWVDTWCWQSSFCKAVIKFIVQPVQCTIPDYSVRFCISLNTRSVHKIPGIHCSSTSDNCVKSSSFKGDLSLGNKKVSRKQIMRVGVLKKNYHLLCQIYE